MKNSTSYYAKILSEKGLKASHQRIMVLDYLDSHRCHPTADMILSALKQDMPTLSKSTVYKTLNAFVDANLLREITIEDNEIRYEYNLMDHGHFKCESCGQVYDFTIDFGLLKTKDLDGFQINDRNIYFKGVCKSCLDNEQNNV
jgi:Fur family peroxide stress response transcriptional regulator